MIDQAQHKVIENLEQGKLSHHFKTRMDKTKELLEWIGTDEPILDLGPDNAMARKMREWGYDVVNTGTVDLDEKYYQLSQYNNPNNVQAKVCTAFEILEHLRNPYMVLKHIQTEYLLITVPLNVWFSGPYWNENDPWDTHYHEFHPKQIRSLLEKTGWKICQEEKWKWNSAPLKPRPLLRKFGPWHSWMAIIAIK